jgi:hypothetical protein
MSETRSTLVTWSSFSVTPDNLAGGERPSRFHLVASLPYENVPTFWLRVNLQKVTNGERRADKVSDRGRGPRCRARPPTGDCLDELRDREQIKFPSGPTEQFEARRKASRGRPIATKSAVIHGSIH